MFTRLIFVLMAGFLTWQSCKPKPAESAVSNIVTESTATPSAASSDVDIATAKQMMADHPDIVLLDVRTPEEIANGKIGEALELDFTDAAFKDKVAALDKNKEYIVYCAAGGRSAKAVSLMNELGFTKAHNMLGGYTAWSEAK